DVYKRQGPVSARISGDPSTPLAVAVSPITVVPDVKAAAENLNIASIVDALTRLSSGAKVELSSPAPLAVALGRIPVDLTISVSSPSSEAVLKVEIKGTIGE
ncbi:MAG: hypothetical protein QUS08_06085, partial [Methanothrix sp.]|nr:hypothetical protein [Methanothrix sp.]